MSSPVVPSCLYPRKCSIYPWLGCDRKRYKNSTGFAACRLHPRQKVFRGGRVWGVGCGVWVFRAI
ncbi:MAG: hypothetical protein EWV84_21290 [Microcystis sp. M_QC_C_20170808_M3Col]|nr:MAG: hypothetical protein EWV84_21290 [Microcystis sp. M_QC_C_20170808_M3Col]